MTEIGSVVLTDGQQHDYIQDEEINKLFEALEVIRKKFKNSMSGDYESVEFNTSIADQEQAITPDYIETIKNYIKAIETSKYVPDEYSHLITVPNAADYIEAGTYYNNYIDILEKMYKHCAHDSSHGSCSYSDSGGGGGGACRVNCASVSSNSSNGSTSFYAICTYTQAPACHCKYGTGFCRWW